MAIDGSGDIVVENGSFRRVTGVDAIAQDVVCRLRYVRGEWYQNRDGGTPYYESIFADDSSDSVRRAVIGRVIRETPGVASLDELGFELDPQARELFVNARFTTTDDEEVVIEHVELQI